LQPSDCHGLKIPLLAGAPGADFLEAFGRILTRHSLPAAACDPGHETRPLLCNVLWMGRADSWLYGLLSEEWNQKEPYRVLIFAENDDCVPKYRLPCLEQQNEGHFLKSQQEVTRVTDVASPQSNNHAGSFVASSKSSSRRYEAHP